MFEVSAFASATARQVMFDGRQSRFAETTARHEHGIADAEEEGPEGLHSSKKLVELVMRTDPCPFNCVTGPFADSANVPAHSYRPVVRVAAQLFEFKRIVPGIDSRSPDRSVASPCDQCSPPGRVPAHRVFLERPIRFLHSIQLLVRLPKAPSSSGNHMRFKSSGSLPSAVACSMKALSLGRGVGSLMISSQRSSSTCASSRNFSSMDCRSASLSFGSSLMISDALTAKL